MKITIKDLKEYLSNMPEDTEIDLDKDGWMEDELGFGGDFPEEVIRNSGLFWYIPEHNVLIINN